MCSHLSHPGLGPERGFRPAAYLDLAGPGHRSCLALHRAGFAWPPRHRDAGALLPHHFTLACARLTCWRAIGGVFLWHFPAAFAGWELPTALALWCPDFPRESPPATAWPALASVGARGACATGGTRDDRSVPEATNGNTRVVRGACPHDCPDTCAMLTTVDESGRAVASPATPTTRSPPGFLCGKVSNYLDRVYADDRILSPLIRTGPKGAGEFRDGELGGGDRRRGAAGSRRRSPSTAASRSSPTATWAPRAPSRAARSRTGS